MDTRKLFINAVRTATSAVRLVQDADYTKPTPDSEWDVKDLASHMLYELSWVPDIVSGKLVSEVGDKYDGDLIGENLRRNWLEAETTAINSVKNCDLKGVAHLSWRDATNEYYLKQAASDQLIHAWDLSAALARPVKFDTEIAEYLYAYNYPNKDRMASSGLFGAELEVPKSSDIQTRLLALYGRDINWSP
ncbi:MAG: TIGR03086 family metal-binding protein [Candidatus Saccharimonadales bacterium]